MSADGEVTGTTRVNSWVVRKAAGRWQLVRSYWQPGYTPSHTDSQPAAKAAALSLLHARREQIMRDIAEVQALDYICTSGCDDAIPSTVDPECIIHGWV